MADDAAYSGIHSRLTREQVAEIEIGQTTVSRPVRMALVAAFLVTAVSVPLIQHVIEIRAGFKTTGHAVWPEAYAVVNFPHHAWEAFNDPAVHGLWAKTQAANSCFLRDVKSYEKGLEDDSFIARSAIPPMQAFTAKYLGLGNEQVYLGRDGWLFYQPEVGYLSGEGFLSPDFLRARARKGHAGEEQQPNPLKAIVDFRDQLKARGIELLLLPAPVKPMIEPEHLSSRYHPPLPIPLQNPSYAAFLRALDAEGVNYLDVSEHLATEKKRTSEAQYLLTDTHWTPQAMELAAAQLAKKIQGLGLPGGNPLQLVRSETTVTNLGDIANMLKLPPSSSALYPRQSVLIHSVSQADGSPWATDPAADILFLGDSFSNIYSLEGMGWGKSAGLVEQLSYDLHQPIDAIRRNDAGAHATREMLARDLAQGHDRLAGKRLVIWEFAMRELSVGDWKMIPLPQVQVAAAKPAADVFYAPPDKSVPVRVTATVDSVSKFPKPGSVPYKDHIFAVFLTDVSGPSVPPGSHAVVYLWSMQNNILTQASGWKVGDHVTLDLQSWGDVSEEYDRFNRSELDDEKLQLEPPCWGAPVK